MSEEFTGDQQVPEGDSAGQPGDSEAQTGPRKIDLTQTPEWRAAQSSYDRQVSHWQTIAQRAEAEANAYKQVLQSADPELANSAIVMARQHQLEMENENYRRQQQYQFEVAQYRSNAEETAKRMGLNPYDPEYQAAISEAIRTGDGSVVEVKRAEMKAAQISSQRGNSASQNNPDSNFVTMPPAGGQVGQRPPSKERDRLMTEFNEQKSKLPPGDLTALHVLRQKFVSRGLSWGDVSGAPQAWGNL